jgi:arsenite methyltransferase
LQATEYIEKLTAAGFDAIEVEPTRVYQVEEAREFLEAAGFDAEQIGPQVRDKFMSAFLRASKPAKQACDCPPGSVDLPGCN